ncbi:MAG: NACHT domain-containing protein [Candidatus Zixiibacteriota bacterium]
MDFFRQRQFDPLTALVTIIVIPIFILILRRVYWLLKNISIYAIDGLLYFLGRFVFHSLATTLSLRRYCKIQLAGNNKYLPVPGGNDIFLNIDDSFVTLAMDHYGGVRDSYTHKNMLQVGNSIRVIGDPGSGKSTLVKRLLRDTCLATSTKSRLPILIELRQLMPSNDTQMEHKGKWLYNEIRKKVIGSNVYNMAECFNNFISTSGLLVLLDGLDEVSASNYVLIKDEINGLRDILSNAGESNVIVLTMRTQFHQQIKMDFADNFPAILNLKTFSPGDIYEFLSRWPFKSDKQDHVIRIYNELTDKPTLREMCSNPLVLAMYVAEDQIRGHADTPETRTEFYLKVTDELIIKRRLKQINSTIAKTKLKEQRERILGGLAYHHLLTPDQSANCLNWNNAMEITSNIMSCDLKTAENLFREIAKETGLVTEEKPGETLRFIHLTFCEFLAAKEAVLGQKDGWQNLINSHRNFADSDKFQLGSRLAEVLPFAIGLLPRFRRYEALNDIVNLKDGRLTALSFLETKNYDHELWPAFIYSERSALINVSENSWDDDWLKRLNLFNVVLRDARQCSIHFPKKIKIIESKEFFQDLIEKQNSSIIRLLDAYAIHDAVAAFRLGIFFNLSPFGEFSEVIIRNMDQKPLFDIIVQRTQDEKKYTKSWCTLLVEAALRKKVVAYWMHRIPVPKIWKINIKSLPPKYSWCSNNITNVSFYTHAITFALSNRKKINGNLYMLNILNTLPTPSSFGYIKWSFIISIILLIFSLLGLGIINSGFENMRNLIIALGISSILNGIILLVMAIRIVLLSSAYRVLLYGVTIPSNIPLIWFFFPLAIKSYRSRRLPDLDFSHLGSTLIRSQLGKSALDIYIRRENNID